MKQAEAEAIIKKFVSRSPKTAKALRLAIAKAISLGEKFYADFGYENVFQVAERAGGSRIVARILIVPKEWKVRR